MKVPVLPAALFLFFVPSFWTFYRPGDDVIVLNETSFDEKVMKSQDLWFVELYAEWCFYSKEFAPEWKNAATALKGIVKVAAIDGDYCPSITLRLKVERFPKIKIFGADKSKPEDYKVFLTALVAGSWALYSSSDDVIELSDANFDARVIQSQELWLVEFYAPWCGHCKNLAPEWKKAASALKGFVNVAAVDSTVHQSLGGRFQVQGFPTIKIFGSNKNNPTDYQGARSASAIVDAAISQLRSIAQSRLSGGGSGSGSGGRKTGDPKDVIELTDSNFEELVLQSEDLWLVEFFAPWCGHCKNLEPHWASAASELKGKVKLGALDATVNTVMASRYGVQGYPTIKMFPSGKKQGEVVDYDGGRTSGDIVAWALDKLAENIPPPEVLELTEESKLKDACQDKQLCIISILPHILDCQSKCRNDYLSILRQQSEKYKKNLWGWLWAEAGSQPDVEKALNIGGFGYPAMAAINVKKMKYSWLKGSFSDKGVNEFLREVSFGRSSTEPLRADKLPEVLTIQGWDGKDGELPVEEDIDLSDVELDDIPTTKSEL